MDKIPLSFKQYLFHFNESSQDRFQQADGLFYRTFTPQTSTLCMALAKLAVCKTSYLNNEYN
ncbi:hypothetical protein MJO28_002346 [Puccinia striiformis f. sp. tritici]|uniref:Uncharacterized protein n=1 Tax=Puccinia striiformis f. sp. tritici TaxID=168172 RepID=A0ACC0EWW2_9BASI|nr:hypothetical protein MJO28_002346 [Puccinia striiformis f. sp. tritici]KAI7966678.1 hypothetical protein MJO29_002426 [Puccinia striiformis f. sp. tritici]